MTVAQKGYRRKRRVEIEGIDMDTILLDRSQLLSLLDLMGVENVIGVESEQLSPLEPFERTLVLDDGRSRLLEQELLEVDEDHYEIDARLGKMLVVVTDPQAVLRIHRIIPAEKEDFWCWYFVSDEQWVRLASSNSEQYELDQLSGIDSAVTQIAEILPLEPVQNELRYRATAEQDDVNLIASLVSDFEEVPALTLMEADGLGPVEAIELYNDLTEPEWRGWIDFLACSSGQITISHRLLVLQGAELSWMAWQDDPDRSDMHVQTATTGALEKHFSDYLSEVIP
jgi:hypothetical protein